MPRPAACKPRGCNANTSNAISSSTSTAPHLARVRKSTPSFHPYLISVIWAMHCSSQITSNSTLLFCPVVNGIADNTHVLPSVNSAPLSTVPLNKACHGLADTACTLVSVCLRLVAFTRVGISKLKCQRERNFGDSGESTSGKAAPA